MRRLLLLVAVLSATALPLQAQKEKKIPKRPRLSAGADTNSWGAYYFHGLQLLEKQPHDAEAAFYWASRLDPTVSEPLYARWIAYWWKDTDRLLRYFTGQKFVVENREVVAMDSLLDRALLRDPFLHRGLEKRLWEKMIEDATGQMIVDFDYRRDPYTKGWIAYTRGEMGLAASNFMEVLRKKPDHSEARLYLARALYFMEEFDSSASQFARVVEEMRKKDQKKLVYFYQSKAHMEYAIGIVHTRAGNLDRAKEDYGRALTEDLSFSMAHSRLAEVAMAMGDTASALLEHDQAIQLRPDDPYLRFSYGVALLQLRKAKDAAEHLRKTIELEPHFASGYFNLALALDMSGQYPDAVTNYRAFLTRAPRTMQDQVALANERIQALADMPTMTSGGSP